MCNAIFFVILGSEKMLIVASVTIALISCLLHSTYKRERKVLFQKVTSLKKLHTVVTMKYKLIYIILIERNNFFIKTKLIIYYGNP